MTKNFFDIIILIGRPASGKSEIIDYLKRSTDEARHEDFHIGKLDFLDDFPMLWTWFEEDHILEKVMGQPRLHTDSEGYFKYEYLWHLLIERFNIPLDEYPRRCVNQIKKWEEQREELVNNKELTHNRTHEYASYIMDAIETDTPYRIHGNVMNTGLITNLPEKAVVEVPCLVDRNGVTPCYVGDLPEQCAAMNRTNINVQLLTIEAALTGKRDYVYQAALMDPHTAAELSIDEIIAMCDDLFKAHGDMLPAMN